MDSFALSTPFSAAPRLLFTHTPTSFPSICSSLIRYPLTPSFNSSLVARNLSKTSLNYAPSEYSFKEFSDGDIWAAAPPQTPATSMRGAEGDALGLLFRERIVFLGSSIDDFVADSIISQLLLLDAQDHTQDIRLFINSSGGSLSATMAIFDVVQLVRADVSTIALGFAASTASLILGGGTKGKRLAMPNTRIMIHQPLGGASGQAIDVEIQAREIMHSKHNVIKLVSGFTGRSVEQVEKDIDRDRYMSPIEAVEFGVIDGVIDKDSIIPLEPVPTRVKSSVFNYQEISKDPKKFLTPEIPDDEIY